MSTLQTFLATDNQNKDKDLETLQRIFKKRRSVRAYLPDKPNKGDILEILDAARYAPNSCNLQHYSFIYIDDEKILEKMANVATRKVFWAPALIVTVDDKRFSQIRRAGLQSTAAATENVILAATAKGLGTCWMAGFVGDDGIRKILDIPDYYEVTGLMAIGYPDPDKTSTPTQRLMLDDYVHINGFEEKEVELLSDLNVDHWPMSKLTNYRERIGSVYAPRKHIQLYHKKMISECAKIYLDLQDKYYESIPDKNTKIIDIASYDGCFVRELDAHQNALSPNTQIYSADHSSYFLNLIEEQCTEVKTIKMNEDHTLDIKGKLPKTYDIMSLVFKAEFLPDTENLLKVLKAVCKDNGRLFLTTLPLSYPRAMAYKIDSKINRSNMYERNKLYRFGPYRHLSSLKLYKAISRSGWKIEKSGTAGAWPKYNFKWLWLSPKC